MSEGTAAQSAPDIAASTATRSVRRTGLGPQIVWASGSFATGALFNAMALFALFYMTTFLGIAPAVAGTIILVARIYDGIIDPLIGALSDRTKHRWGPRRIYLLIGAIALGGTFALYFNLAGLGFASDGAVSPILIALVLMLYSTAYSVFSIPYLAMPPEIEPDYDGRTRLMSFRVFFLLLGVTAGSVGAPALVQISGGEQAGYETMGTVIGLAAMVMCLFVFFGAARLPKPQPIERDESLNTGKLLASPFVDTWRVMGNLPFRLLTLVKLCQLAVLATVLASTPYFFGFVLNLDQGQIAQYFLAFSLAGMLSIPAYRWLIAKVGKKVFTFVENVAGALGPFIVGLILQANGLIQTRDTSVEQPQQVLDAVIWCASIVPALFCFAAVPFLMRYNLDGATLQKMRRAKA